LVSFGEVKRAFMEAAGFTEKEFNDYFTVEDKGDHWFLRQIDYLERKTWQVCLEVAGRFDGKYEGGVPRGFVIPKKEGKLPSAREIQGYTHCENCGVGTFNGREWEGYVLCPVCYDQALERPDEFKRKLKPKQPVKKQKPVKEYKPKDTWEHRKDTWEHRKARMQPAVSRMEEAVLAKLQELGVPVEFQKQFCLQSTTPDFYLPKANVAVYLDGAEAHKGRESRDEELRELLARRYGIRVVSIPYDQFSPSKAEEIAHKIAEEPR